MESYCESAADRFPRWATIVVLLLPALAIAADAADVAVGPFSIRAEPYPAGITISVGDVVVSQGSTLVVTTPPWTPHHYLGPDATAIDTAAIEPTENGRRLILSHHSGNRVFSAREVITIEENGRITQEFDADISGDSSELLVQFQIAAINPALIIGRKFKLWLADELKTGVVPVLPVKAASKDPLAKGAFRVDFESRIGPISVEVESTTPLILYDYRSTPWSDSAHPKFWLGDDGSRHRGGEKFRYKVTYRLPLPPQPKAVSLPQSTAAEIHEAADAQTWPLDPAPPLVPRPKWCEFENSPLLLADEMPPSFAKFENPDASESENRFGEAAVADWGRFLTQRAGVRLNPDSTAIPPHLTLRRRQNPEYPTEGYSLTVDEAGALLQARTEAGFLNGVRTLKQLTLRDRSDRLFIRGVDISDEPDLVFRGVHLFTGGKGPAIHLQLLRRILGDLKMNALVLQTDYLKWDCCPEIHHPDWGMSKSDVRQILDVAREEAIDVIPLINSPGHMLWMFHNDQNLDLCEDPAYKYQYCITNPKTYEFLFKIYEEAIELFRPRTLHIGHDEFTDRGRVPFRESSKPYSVEQLFTMDTLRIHDWLTRRGIRVMMWGDMLLARGEAPDATSADSPESARRLRDAIPDDVTIADWHYVAAPSESFRSLDLFRTEGHSAIAATWLRPGNIVNFAKAAYEKKAAGLLQTTWARYSLDPETFEKFQSQYSAYVLASEAAWNASRPPDPEDFDGDGLFFDLMGLSSLAPANRSGWTADLARVFNYTTAAADDGGWFGFGPDHDLAAAPRGAVRLKGVLFQCAPHAESGNSAVVVESALTRSLDLPRSVTIEVNRTASTLVALHAANFAGQRGQRVGSYVVRYDDGGEHEIPLEYSRNILAYTDRTARPDAPILWSGKTRAGERVAMRGLIWNNPTPQRRISSVTIRSGDAAGGPMVFALTGLN